MLASPFQNFPLVMPWMGCRCAWPVSQLGYYSICWARAGVSTLAVISYEPQSRTTCVITCVISTHWCERPPPHTHIPS